MNGGIFGKSASDAKDKECPIEEHKLCRNSMTKSIDWIPTNKKERFVFFIQ